MVVKTFLLKSFSDENSSDSEIEVPTGSNLLKAMIFHDGIYAFYEVPETTMTSIMTDRFRILGKNSAIPLDSQFIDILDIVVELPLEEGETEHKQGIQTIPIYKLLN